MKTAMITAVSAILLFHGIAAACSIQNRRETLIGERKAVEGDCSNNGMPVTCQYIEGEGITCDGPSGSYSGYDLNALVYSACGCSSQEEQEQKEKKEL